jgi:hypothetical protein
MRLKHAAALGGGLVLVSVLTGCNALSSELNRDGADAQAEEVIAAVEEAFPDSEVLGGGSLSGFTYSLGFDIAVDDLEEVQPDDIVRAVNVVCDEGGPFDGVDISFSQKDSHDYYDVLSVGKEMYGDDLVIGHRTTAVFSLPEVCEVSPAPVPRPTPGSLENKLGSS